GDLKRDVLLRLEAYRLGDVFVSGRAHRNFFHDHRVTGNGRRDLFVSQLVFVVNFIDGIRDRQLGDDCAIHDSLRWQWLDAESDHFVLLTLLTGQLDCFYGTGPDV